MSRIEKAFMASVVVLALPLIVPLELYHRLRWPEYRWSKYPATMAVRRPATSPITEQERV